MNKIILSLTLLCIVSLYSQTIPLPEHPRPDFKRSEWINLNGDWNFRFHPQDRGNSEQWYRYPEDFGQEITVPFPWGAPLSGITDQADIGWYHRDIVVPQKWKSKQVHLIIGASDWHTTVWLDGHKIGEHRGGYTPIELDLTPYVYFGTPQKLVIRADDTEHEFKLFGKQGYGNARGIWQTVYLEARPQEHIDYIHFTPDIDTETVTVKGEFARPLQGSAGLILTFMNSGVPEVRRAVKGNTKEFEFVVKIEDPRLWTLENPFLYNVEVELLTKQATDRVSTYFGMRKISVEMLPGTDFPYVALNNEPVYLQMALDQAYHPEGYYTYPSDEFIRNDILRTRRLGLNGQRIHVKIDPPRKLYWADRLGVLIMADVPNSWGEPTEPMQQDFLTALRGMLKTRFQSSVHILLGAVQ
ncbi:MAG: hypothetical protein U5R06_24615 [candidate division KSB1 bacterium]|nr:hypothetical protein [candidate division KSB1 bacterium]